MLGHDHVSVHVKSVVLANAFQRRDKCCAGLRTQEMWTPVITTKGKEMNLFGFVDAFQSPL